MAKRTSKPADATAMTADAPDLDDVTPGADEKSRGERANIPGELLEAAASMPIQQKAQADEAPEGRRRTGQNSAVKTVASRAARKQPSSKTEIVLKKLASPKGVT